MKKDYIKKIGVLVIAIITSFLLSACGGVDVEIHFDSNGGTEVESIETSGTTTISLPDNPEKEGYIFGGWFWDDETFEESFTANSLLDTPLSSSMTVYARWVDPNVEEDSGLPVVTYHNTGDSDIEPFEIGVGAILEVPSVSKEGHRLEGWYTSLDDGTSFDERWSFTTSRVYVDTDLYANWEILDYTVSFDNGLSDEVFESRSITYNETIELPDISLDGYHFNGWLLDGEHYEGEITIKTDAHLVADFEEIIYHTVSFESASDASFEEITVEQGETIDLPKDTLDHHRFLGWTLDGEAFSEEDPVMDDITLVADFEAINYYQISFDSGEGSEIPPIKDIEEYTTVQALDTPELFGYAFKGWLYEESLIEAPFTYDFDQDITLEAKWESVPVYEITFDSLSGSAIESILVEENQTIESLPESHLEHYRLKHWLYEGEPIDTPFTYDFDKDITLVAEFVAINYYEITFDSTSGAAVDSLEDIEEYTIVESLPTPTSDDYIFQGWLYDDELIEAPFEYDFDQDITLVATWRPAEIYQVEFTSIVGSIDALEFSEINDMVEDLPEPTYDNFVFEAWVLDGEEIELPFQMTEDITLEAVWTAKDNGLSLKTYQDGLIITGYDGDQEILDIPKMYQDIAIIAIAEEAFSGETSIKTLNLLSNILIIEENAFLSSTIEEINSEFLIQPQGWHDHFNPDNITVNFTSITISFETHGSEEIAAIEIYEPSDLNLSVPVKEGYIFSHWYLDADYEEVFDDANFPNADITLHAKWVADHFDYSSTSKGVTIENYTGNVSVLTIPEYIEGLPVTVINSFAIHSHNIIEITLADNIEVLKTDAINANNMYILNISKNSKLHSIETFAILSGNLSSLFLPSHLEDLKAPSLLGLRAIQTIQVCEDNPYFTDKEGVLFTKDLEKLVFYPSQKSDVTFTVPKEITVIGPRGFGENRLIESIVFPEDSLLHTIKNGAFYQLSNLKSLNLPKNLKTLERNNVFYRNINLAEIEVHEDNPYFKTVDGVLYDADMKYLIHVNVDQVGVFNTPDSVIKVVHGAFGGSRFEEVIFTTGSALQTIDQHAFNSMPNLQSIKLPASLNSIHQNGVFNDSNNLERFDIHEDNPYYVSVDGVLYDKHMTTLIKYPAGKTDDIFLVPDSVRIIGEIAFRSSSVNKISFSKDSHIHTISRWAFDRSKITEIFIPDSVSTIEREAFISLQNTLTIYVEASEKPLHWHDDWYRKGHNEPTIIWDAERD